MTLDRSKVAIARGVLLGTFAGDALGARWEGGPPVTVEVARRRLDASQSATTLAYTDDTQLTLALAEHLCLHPEVEPAALAATFLDHFEPHRGYARGMFAIVEAWERGVPPAQAARSLFGDGSFGNGAAMRVAPVAVVWHDDLAAVDSAARTQAALTHAHPIGTDAAAAQAGAVARAITTGRFTADDIATLAATASTEPLRRALSVAADLAGEYVAGGGGDVAQIAATVGTGVLADQSVPAALWVAAVAADFTEAVVLSLALGGDVDTIAAMACAVVGGALTDEALPHSWVESFEDGGRGRSYAADLARRLAHAAGRRCSC